VIDVFLVIHVAAMAAVWINLCRAPKTSLKKSTSPGPRINSSSLVTTAIFFDALRYGSMLLRLRLSIDFSLVRLGAFDRK